MIWAVLLLASPGVSAIADGHLERQSFGAPAAHLEASSTAACRAAHPADCGLCQLLARPMTASRAVLLPRSLERLGARVPEVSQRGVEPSLFRLPDARAPPSA